ncbi:MAG: CopD family protein [Nitrososphaerales archaeon]
MVSLINLIILWIHIFSAILFVGGSFFIWLIIVPASKEIFKDEKERTLALGKIAKRFGKLVYINLITLILTGLYSLTWYLPSFDLLNPSARVLLIKVTLVFLMIILIYIHNIYFGKRITKLAKENKMKELWNLRRMSRKIAYSNLILMALITFLAVFL